MPRLSAANAMPRRRLPFEVDELIAEFVSRQNNALTAYEIAARLTAGGNRISAPQVYRSLDRLVKDVRVRRIEGLNAYFPSAPSCDAVIYCRRCRRYLEISCSTIVGHLVADAGTYNFATRQAVVEIAGICSSCRSKSDGLQFQ